MKLVRSWLHHANANCNIIEPLYYRANLIPDSVIELIAHTLPISKIYDEVVRPPENIANSIPR